MCTLQETSLPIDTRFDIFEREDDFVVNECEHEYDEDECEIDLEGELIYALYEIKKLREKNQSLELQL